MGAALARILQDTGLTRAMGAAHFCRDLARAV